MPNSPPDLSLPLEREPFLDRRGNLSHFWRQWFNQLHGRVGGAIGRPIIGNYVVFEKTIAFGDLASAASVIVLDARADEKWKVRDIFLSGGGTNFSGGDRLLTISDGTSTWSVIPAATLQSLAAARWGEAGVPYPATAAHMTAETALGTDISASYSGGATDYTAGSLTLMITAERTA